jgi:long-chain fatty acid transport protein
MRKLLFSFIALLITGSLFGAGLVTNTNQSATWVRLPARNASTGIDAAYYNPAGLMKLSNGFHFSLSNQSIWQKREVINTYTKLNSGVYKGNVNAPLFPSVYAVYKMDKIAISLGFGPIGGGGGAEFKNGLPSFEMSASDLVPSLASKAGVTGYKVSPYFKGSSTFLGFQGGISYKINDMISVAAGLRYMSAKNTYEGYLNDIQLSVGASWLPASAVLTNLATQLTGITGIPTKLAPAISGGFGGQTLAVLVGAGAMTAADKSAIEQGLAAIGVPAAAIPTMTVSTISATVTGATPALNDQIATLNANASLVQNQSADVEQTGSGYTPFFSVNITPVENLNIAIKYEMRTKIELTNKTTKDFTSGYYTKNGNVTSPQSLIPDMTRPITMFPDGEKVRNDMPALITLGVDYKFTNGLKAAVGFNYYWDKDADYGHKIDDDINSSTPSVHIANNMIIGDNGFSFCGGIEYPVTKKILVSGGYVWANQGVNSTYQSDLNYGLGTQTFGIGAAYNVTEKIQVNIGAGWTKYDQDTKIINHTLGGVNQYPTETYKKDTKMIGIGVDLSF